jgi:hypothetical protein
VTAPRMRAFRPSLTRHHLLAQLSELNELREQVRKAELSARKIAADPEPVDLGSRFQPITRSKRKWPRLRDLPTYMPSFFIIIFF